MRQDRGPFCPIRNIPRLAGIDDLYDPAYTIIHHPKNH